MASPIEIVRIVILLAIFVIIKCEASNPKPDYLPKPVASWTFTSANGGSDLSENGRNPVTMTNIKYKLGPHGEPGGAAVLPQSYDQAMVVMNPTDELRFTDTMTYFTRVYLTGIEGAFFEYNTGLQEEDGDIGSLLWLWYSDTSLRVEGTGFDVEATDVLQHNRWTDIAVAWNTSSLSFYVDGILVNTTEGSTNLKDTESGHIHFGYRPGIGEYFLSGRLACSQFFDTALDADAVQKLTCDGEVLTPKAKDSVEPVASWTFKFANGGSDLSEKGQNPVTMTNIKYDQGPNGEPGGAAVLPQSFDQAMVVTNPTDELRFTDTMTYFTTVYLTGKEGAFFEYNTGLLEEDGDIECLLWLWYSDTSLKVERTGFDVEATNVLQHNRWTDIAVAWNTSSLSFYVDGILVNRTKGLTNLTKTQSGHLHFGYRPGTDDYNHFLSGRMACSQFFNRTLDADEVQKLTCDVGIHVPRPKPVASWTFTAENGGNDLSQSGENPVKLTKITYDIGPNGEPKGAAVLPQSFYQSMAVMYPTKKLRFTDAMTYFTRVKLTGTLGALFEYNTGLRGTPGVVGSLLWVWSSRTDLRVENTGFDVEASDVLKLNRWTDLAVVWDTLLLSFYVDGKLVKSTKGSLNMEETRSGRIHFGYRPGHGGHILSGRLACSQFFDTALTAEEIRVLACD